MDSLVGCNKGQSIGEFKSLLLKERACRTPVTQRRLRVPVEVPDVVQPPYPSSFPEFPNGLFACYNRLKRRRDNKRSANIQVRHVYVPVFMRL